MLPPYQVRSRMLTTTHVSSAFCKRNAVALRVNWHRRTELFSLFLTCSVSYKITFVLSLSRQLNQFPLIATLNMPGTKIYVGNPSWATTHEDLLSAFWKYGKIVASTVVTARGSGFLDFSRPEEAENALSMDVVKLNDGCCMPGYSLRELK